MKRIGNQTLCLENGIFIIGRAALVGEKETNGTYKKYMKSSVENDKMGEKTFEKKADFQIISKQICQSILRLGNFLLDFKK